MSNGKPTILRCASPYALAEKYHVESRNGQQPWIRQGGPRYRLESRHAIAKFESTWLFRDLLDTPIGLWDIHNLLKATAGRAAAINAARDLSSIRVGLHDEILHATARSWRASTRRPPAGGGGTPGRTTWGGTAAPGLDSLRAAVAVRRASDVTSRARWCPLPRDRCSRAAPSPPRNIPPPSATTPCPIPGGHAVRDDPESRPIPISEAGGEHPCVVPRHRAGTTSAPISGCC